MKGTKRFAVSDSTPDTNDVALRNKRIMAGSQLDAYRAEPSQQESMATQPPLDVHRAESSRQHVRALNTQFASWVQSQLKNHPDELWEDGIRDYLSHASNIMEKFSDVVNWLKANSVKGGNLSAAESQSAGKKSVPEIKNDEVKTLQEKNVFAPAGTTKSFGTTLSFGTSPGFNAAPNFGTSFGTTSILGTTTTSGTTPIFGLTPDSGTTASFATTSTLGTTTTSGTTPIFGLTPASGVATRSGATPSFGLTPSSGTTTRSGAPPSFGLAPSSGATTSSGMTQVLGTTPSFGMTTSTGTTTSFAASWSSGVFSNNQTPALFGSQNSAPKNNSAADDGEDDEPPQPSSPSVKKSEEKGVVVVHEVKCKLYVKSSDPADKDAWKDKGTGQLTIKCKEGVEKGTKESKPTIVVRNDVGKAFLNALLYPGVKTNKQKNSVVAIFHTSADDGGGSDSVVARTFLIRTKTAEDRDKLATAIQEYAPVS